MQAPLSTISPPRLAAVMLALCGSACATSAPPAADAGRTPGPGSITAAAAATAETDTVLEAINPPEAIAAARRRYGQIEFLGESTIVSGTELDGSVVGGLSGIAWLGGDRYAAVSDDRGNNGDGRFYILRVDLSDGLLTPAGVELLDWIPVLGADGKRLQRQTFDMEGIAAAPDGTFYISSEGVARALIPPSVDHVAPDGRHLGRLTVPRHLEPTADGASGVRDNLALESVSVTPDGRTLFTAAENALLQDGPKADFTNPSPTRLVMIDLQTGRLLGEYVYVIDAVDLGTLEPDTYHTRGLVDLVALDARHLLALERSFVAGVGFSASLYRVSLQEATNVMGIEALPNPLPATVRPVRKELLLDLGQLGIRLDNMEGMGLGEPLPNDRRALLLIGDNNFNLAVQITQLLAFAIPVQLVAPR